MMKQTIKTLSKPACLLVAAVLALATSSCVRDGNDPCPNHLSFVYDYNMEFVDLFHRQVTFMSMFMFDAQTGKLVREVKLEANPFDPNYTIDVPKHWHGTTYDIVVWAGLDADSYEFTPMEPGKSTQADFDLKVKGYEDRRVNRTQALEPLWHGKLTGVEFTEMEEKTHVVKLMKDTKKFRLVVQTLDEGQTLSADDLDIHLASSGGHYDNDNNVLDPADRYIDYLPYFTQTNADTGVAAEMNSLRLMNDGRANSLHITNRHTGQPIVQLPLIKYLDALRLLQYSSMNLQEYLDREDTYYILIIIKKDGNKPDGAWLAVQVEINDWIIRFQEIEDL